MRNPLVLVFSGPSGSGKSTLLKMIMDKYASRFAFSVSHTTRPIRPGEVDGRDYHFVSKEQMVSDVAAGKFLESAEFAGNLYGTSKAAVESVLTTGRICVLDVEIEGVKSIHAVRSPWRVMYILIRPLLMESLELRLRNRGTETEETIRRRIDRARRDMEFYETEAGKQLFDVVIINDVLDVAYKALEDALRPFLESS